MPLWPHCAPRMHTRPPHAQCLYVDEVNQLLVVSMLVRVWVRVRVRVSVKVRVRVRVRLRVRAGWAAVQLGCRWTAGP